MPKSKVKHAVPVVQEKHMEGQESSSSVNQKVKMEVPYNSVNPGAKIPKEMSFEDGNLAMNWEFFKQKFNIYLTASRMEHESDAYKAALLLNVVGDKVIKIFNNLEFDRPEDRNSYIEIINKLNNYFIPKKNVTFERYIFFTRDMKPSEGIDEYVNELRRLSGTCEFGTLTDSLIRDRIILGIQDKNLKDRLFREVNLDLKRATEVCKAAELAKEQLKSIEGQKTQEVDTVAAAKPRNIPQKSQAVPKTLSRSSCFRCGGNHINNSSCPARSVGCNKCKKIGHYARCCRTRKVSIVDRTEEQELTEKASQLFVGNVSKQDMFDASWVQNCMLDNNVNVYFKLDTGAQANILPLEIFKKLAVSKKAGMLKVSLSKLTGYNDKVIETIGSCEIKTQVGNKQEFIEYHIVNTKNCPLLGLDACIKLNLVKRNAINNVQVHKSDVDSLQNIIKKFNDCFEGTGCLNNTYHIALDPNVKPVIHPPRKVPFAIHQQLKNKLNSLEAEGIVSKVTTPTPWVNSLVIVHKKDGSLRLCLDPTNLNKAIQREHFQIPTMDEIISKVSGAKFFSTVDCSNGFWQIKLDSTSSDLCTFNTPFGRYKFLRMPYGISSAPEVFTKTIKQMYDSIEGVDVYVDDILIWGSTLKEHNERLVKVFKIAREHNLKFNKFKCKFGLQEIAYMGHRITDKGVLPDLSKIEAIKNLQTPQNKKDIERLLGMVQYLARFIPNSSILTEPLRKLLKKDIEFQWNHEQEQALQQLKILIANSPVLNHFDTEKAILVSCDASQAACGAVLLQEGKPVSYVSRAFTPTQQGYAQIEKEMLAIVVACEKFHQYIYGRNDVTIETDHRPLVSIYNKPLTSAPARLQRMLIKLQQYTFKLVYKKGSELFIADTLSRSFSKDTAVEDNDYDAQLCMITKNFNATDKRLKEIKKYTFENTELKELCQFIKEGFPEHKTNLPDYLKKYWSFRDELTVHDNIIYKGTKVFIPIELRKDILKRIHYNHLGKEKCKNLAREVLFWPGLGQDIDNLIENCDICSTFRKNNSKETLLPHTVPDKEWYKVGVDLFTVNGLDYLVLVDYFSKFVELKTLNSLTANSVIAVLKEIFSRQGIPVIVFTDNGPCFSAEEFLRFSKQYDFQHHTSSPRYPQSNGQIERTVQTVKQLLKKCYADNKDPYLALLSLRNTPIASNMPSPSQMLNSRRLRDLLPATEKQLKKTVVSNNKVKTFFEGRKEEEANYYNRNVRDLSELKVKTRVKTKVNINDKEWVNGTIVRIGKRPRTYVIKLDHSNDVIVRNRKFIIKCNLPVNLPDVGAQHESPVKIKPKATRSGRVIKTPAKYSC